jgi:hypothetical protein
MSGRILLNDGSIINVYNYNEGVISVPSHINPMGHNFYKGSKDSPYILPLTFGEIRFINGQSQIFREGFLRFEPEIEEEVYKALQIHNWESIMSDKDIEDIILNPTKEKLDRLIKITSISLFERVRCILTKMKNIGVFDISNRVVDTIEYRYQELYRNKLNSDIVIYKTKQEMMDEIKTDAFNNEIDKMKAEIEKNIRAEVEAEFKKKYKAKDNTEKNKVIDKDKSTKHQNE